MQVWVLTREHNDHDQYGEYFVAVFGGMPKHTELTARGVPQNRLAHVLKGGGRTHDEDAWFFLRAWEVGQVKA